MDLSSMTARDALIYGTLINAGIGFVLGLIPLIAGLVKRNIKFGILGFFCSIVGAAILGIVLAVPASAIFTWLIVRGPRPAVDNPSSTRGQ
jgi:hypothetical protein